MKLKKISFVLGVCLSMAVSGTALADEPIHLQINGKNLPTEVAPVIRDNRTLVPVRVISESLGADVNWDGVNKKVTIIKNDKKLELTIGSTEVLSNGQALPPLDVAPQIINNSTMVPVRVVSEALGAEVKWDQGTRTVVTTYAEKKDEMTAEELMVKSNEAMQKYESYKFTGSGDIAMDIPGAPNNLSIKTDMEGSFKRTGNKLEMYQVQTVDVPSIGGETPAKQKIEMYTDGSQIYMKMDGQDWQKLDLGLDLTKLMNNQDPQKAMQMVQDFGLIVSYGNDTKIEGKDYYTLVVKVDSEKYLAAMKDMIDDLAPAGQEDTLKLLNEMLSNLKFDMTEKIYIAKDTYEMTKVSMDGKISMSLQGSTINEKIKMDMNLSGFGEPVTMPQISK